MSPEQPISDEPSPPPPQATAAAAPAEQHEGAPSVHPSIWVASLSDYNNGILHGAWIDAARDQAELQADIEALLAASPWTARTGEPAEEWAIHDHDGFAPLRLDEHDSLRWISRVANGIAEHGAAFAAYADVVKEEELLANYDADYLGHYDDLHTYNEQLINDSG